jgi:hypothetical protein
LRRTERFLEKITVQETSYVLHITVRVRREVVMNRARSTHRSITKPHGRRLVGRPRRRGEDNTRAVCKVRGLRLLLRVSTLWRCGDGLFFEVPPLASDPLLTTLHPLLENVLQTLDHIEISCLGAPFSWLEKPRNSIGRDLI